MKKIFRKIHLWLSVPFGLIITIACLSGAILVFETEITELCNPTRFYVEEVREKPLTVGQLMKAADEQLSDTIMIASVQVSSDPEKNYRLNFPGRHSGAAFIDPYSGKIREVYVPGDDFFLIMRRLHRWLLDEYKRDGTISVGKTIVGVSTLVFVLILITGVIVWIPKTVRALKRCFKIGFRQGLKRFFYDLHTAGGMYALVLLLVMSLTGLTWSFTWYRTGFYKLFGVEMAQDAPHGGQGNQQGTARKQKGESKENTRSQQMDRPEGERRGEKGNGGQILDENQGEENPSERDENRRGEGRDRQGEHKPQDNSDNNFPGGGNRQLAANPVQVSVDYSVWQSVLQQLMAKNPDFKTIIIQDGKASVATSKIFGNVRASDSYTFDAETGEITDVKFYKDQDKSGKIRGWIYTVHVGSWGGLFSKIITFIAALIGASLPLTGYYLWIKKYMSRKKKSSEL